MGKQMVSPVGTALWAKVIEPDTKFNADGVYSVDLVLSKEQGTEFIKQWSAELTKYKKEEEANLKGKKGLGITADLPWKKTVDAQGNETGEFTIKFKQKAKIRRKDGSTVDTSVVLFDSKAQKIENPSFLIGNGSKVKVAYTPYFYTMKGSVGVSLRLSMLQIIDLVEYGNTSPFDAVEGDGFTAEEEASDEGVFTSEDSTKLNANNLDGLLM